MKRTIKPNRGSCHVKLAHNAAILERESECYKLVNILIISFRN